MKTQLVSRSRMSRPQTAVAGVSVLALGLAGCGLGDEDDDDFPSAQIEVIIPWSAGGGTDQTVRQMASLAEESCDTNIVVTNQEGAGGVTGHEAMANAEPDGYTVGAATVEVSIYDHLDTGDVSPADLLGVMRFSANPAVLSVNSDSPYESVQDLIAAMEAGETVRVGTNGTGGIWDIAAAGLEQATGVEFTERVPYDGGADMIAAILGDQIEAIAPSGAESMGQIESGDLRPLATMADERLEVLPDVPTLQEEGIDWAAANWFGLVVPDGTPQERVSALNECFTEAFETDEFVDFMETVGFGLAYLDDDEFDAFMDEEFDAYGELIAELYG
jgi:tripartite-type tricarboxylate transporter receptor subunit TctC